MSKHEKALFAGYASLVNGKETNVVEVVKRSETLSAYGQTAIGGFAKTGADLDAEAGGGQRAQAGYEPGIVNMGAEGSYAAIVMDSQASLNSYSDHLGRASLPGELLAHELIGHGLGGRATYSDGVDEAIQAGNLYLQATGRPYFRKDHGAVEHSAGFNPRAIPSFLVGSLPFWQR